MTPPWNDMPPSQSLQDLDRIGEVEFRAVEEDVAEPAAEDDPQGRVEDHVVGMTAGHRRAGPVDQLQQIPPADQDPGEIGERIPAQRERPVEQGRARARDRRTGRTRRPPSTGLSVMDRSRLPPPAPGPNRRGKRKRKGRVRMPSELDRKFDAVLAQVTGPGGRIQIAEDGEGRKIVTNLPPTLPGLFDAFCALHGATTAVDRRRRAPDLRRAERPCDPAGAGAGRRLGHRQGRPGRDRDAQLPELDRRLHGGAEGGRNRHPGQRLVAAGRASPRPRPDRALPRRCATRRGRSGSRRPASPSPHVVLPVEKPIAEALAPLLDAAARPTFPRSRPRTTRPSSSPPARPASPRARFPPTAPSPPESMPIRSSLLALLGIMESEGRPPANPPRTLVNVPLFHVTGEVPVHAQQLRHRPRAWC